MSMENNAGYPDKSAGGQHAGGNAACSFMSDSRNQRSFTEYLYFFSQSLNQSVVKFATFVVQKIACQNFQYYFLLWVKKKQ